MALSYRKLSNQQVDEFFEERLGLHEVTQGS